MLLKGAGKSIAMSPRRPIEIASSFRLRWRLRTHGDAGFTLLELITALAVSLIILITLMESLTQASRSWTGQSKSFSEQREVRAGLRILADDLEAIVPVPLPVNASTTIGLSQFILQPPGNDYDSSRLAFLRASRPDKENGTEVEQGDLRLVLYQVVLTPSGGASSVTDQVPTQKLMRKVMSPADTMTRLEEHRTSGTPLVNEQDWAAMNAEGADVEVVADYVVRFSVQPFRELPPPGTSVSPVRTWDEKEMPAWVDVALRVTNRATSAMLRTESDWRGRGNFQKQLINGTPDDPYDDVEVMTTTMLLPLNQPAS